MRAKETLRDLFGLVALAAAVRGVAARPDR